MRMARALFESKGWEEMLFAPPHITVIEPFELRASLWTVECRLAQAIRACRPIKLKLGEYRFFEQSRVLYRAVEPEQRLRNLNLHLRRKLGDLAAYRPDYSPSGASYTPHMTLVRNLDEADQPLVNTFLEEAYVEYEWTVDMLELWVREPDTGWSLDSDFFLRATPET